ncbi:MAG: hypothetical protein AB7O69_17665, partial [Burkholderiales bacterium]
MNKRSQRWIAAAVISAAAAFAPQVSFAAGISAGDTIKLTDSYGTNSGGEFTATILTGAAAPGSFQTFCVEHNETFSYGQTLWVGAVNTGSVNGGVSRADGLYPGPTAPTSTFDPISFETAWLFTQFSNQTLVNYDYDGSSAQVADGTSLQRAIWYLEGEGDWGYSGDAQAQAWVALATTQSSSWTDIGNVRVLNLYKNSSL